jgi:hypothetical protein
MLRALVIVLGVGFDTIIVSNQDFLIRRNGEICPIEVKSEEWWIAPYQNGVYSA